MVAKQTPPKTTTTTKQPPTKTSIDLSLLNVTQLVSLLDNLSLLDTQIRYNKMDYLYPDSGPYARKYYPKSVEFFNATKKYKTVVQLGGNRSGKSYDSNYLITLTATGLYPDWWDGFRPDDPKEIWSTGVTNEAVRDISQTILLGPINDIGSGMIPKSCIVGTPRMKQGIPNAIDHVLVRHASGNVVKIAFKSYQQGRESFQGTSIDLIVFDEEPKDRNIFSEGLARTLTTKGKCVFTFTPLMGLTSLILDFLPYGRFPYNNVLPGQSVYVMQKTWDDVPHLDAEERQAILASFQPFEREARTKGLPVCGDGRVFTTPESDFCIEPFDPPLKWPRVYGLDIAFTTGVTCAVFAAIDSAAEIVYIYDVYKCTGQPPEVAASAIRRRGEWIPGVVDPSSKKYGSKGVPFITEYQSLGLDISPAKNDVMPGLLRFSTFLSEGRLKVMSNCTPWLEEYRIYRFAKTSSGITEIAKNQNDHAMDATRYLLMSGLDRGISYIEHETKKDSYMEERMRRELRNRDRDPTTGY